MATAGIPESIDLTQTNIRMKHGLLPISSLVLYASNTMQPNTLYKHTVEPAQKIATAKDLKVNNNKTLESNNRACIKLGF